MRLPFGIVIVRGRSMEPTYVDGDRLVVRYGPRVHPGRAHVVRLPDGPAGARPIGIKRITHRVGADWWLAKDNPGAGVDSADFGAVPPASVLAAVLFRLPRRGRV